MLGHNRLFTAFAITASVASAFEISNSCKASATRLLSNPDADCFNRAGLAKIVVAGDDLPTSVQNWLSGFCTMDECSKESLASLVSNVTSGCLEDWNLFHIGSTDSELETIVTNLVQKWFPTLRQAVCLKDTTSGLFCPADVLTKLRNVVGVEMEDFLTLNIIQKVGGLESADLSKFTCNQCVASTYSVMHEDLSDEMMGYGIDEALTATCGADFISGGIGESIEETASGVSLSAEGNSETSDTNSAIAVFSPAVWTLTAVTTVFTIIL